MAQRRAATAETEEEERRKEGRSGLHRRNLATPIPEVGKNKIFRIIVWKKFTFLLNAFERERMYPDASDCIQMHPNGSQHVRKLWKNFKDPAHSPKLMDWPNKLLKMKRKEQMLSKLMIMSKL